MRLWTVQPAERLRQLERQSVLIGQWPLDPTWRRAYEWMAGHLVSRGISREPAAPIWAWHSCRGWLRPPDALTTTALLSEAEWEADPHMIEFDAPDELCLLSVYSVWNDVLYRCIDRHADPFACAHTLFDVGRARLDGEEGADDIQACVPRLEWHWVRVVARARRTE